MKNRIDFDAVTFSAIRAQGAGGQHVNKVSSAVHLRYDIHAANNLSDDEKKRICQWPDSRINNNGVIVIKAQQSRVQKNNQTQALLRLEQLLDEILKPIKTRKPTKPSKAAKKRRLLQKNKRSETKRLRSKTKLDQA